LEAVESGVIFIAEAPGNPDRICERSVLWTVVLQTATRSTVSGGSEPYLASDEGALGRTKEKTKIG
jgi:hypothetical protein